jgi:PAS domain S-box-containing protein
MSEKINILIVEDLPTDAELAEREVRQALPDSEFLRVETREDFLAALASFRPGLILSDFKLPQFDGLTALRLARERAPDTPFIILTGSMNEDTAVECMKAGAWDYVIKEHVKRLGQAVLGSLEQKRLRDKRKLAEEALRRASDEYRALAENLPDLLARFDSKLRHVYVNAAAARAGVLSAEQYIGKTISETGVPAPIAKEWDDRIRAVFLTGKPFTMETEFATPEGNRFFLTSLVPERADDGSVRSVLSIARDITEHKLAEMALRESEDKFRTAFATSPDAIYIVTLEEGRMVEANISFFAMFGYKREEIIGKTFLELDLYEDPAERNRIVSEIKTKGFVKDLETWGRRKNGSRILASLSITSLNTGTGPYLLGVIRDITERNRAAKALMESETRYKTLFESARDGMALAEAETGILVDCNQALCDLVEREKAEIVGRCQSVLHPPEDIVEGLSASFREHKANAHSMASEDSLLSKRGKTIPVEIRAAHIRYNDCDFLLGIFRDITERQRAEEKVMNQLNELRRWHDVTLSREERIGVLKREVNELAARLGEPPRYGNADAAAKKT